MSTGDANGDREIQKDYYWNEKGNQMHFHSEMLWGSDNNKIEEYMTEDANMGVFH